MGRVLAVPDPRTSSIIVMASKTLMPQIADMIAELDSDKGRKEVVGFYDLQNADPQDVQSALQDLFNRNTRDEQQQPEHHVGAEQSADQARAAEPANHLRRDHRTQRKFHSRLQRHGRRLLTVSTRYQQQLG